MATENLNLKLVTAVAVFVFTFAFSILPYYIKSFKSNKTLIGVTNCLAGGIFLAAALLHLIPEAIETYENAVKKTEPHTHDHMERHDPAEPHEHSHGFPVIPFAVFASFAAILMIDRLLLPGHHGAAHDHGEKEHKHEGDYHSLHQDHDHEEVENLADGHAHGHNHPSAATPLILLVAMGVHATFEGLALGLRKEFKSFAGFLMAILFHKWAEALAVGVSMFKAKVPKFQAFIYLAIFSLLTPAGVGLGIVFSDAEPKLKAIMLAVSSGTFVYIAIAEIISEEFAGSQKLWLKYVAFWVGAGIMLLTMFSGSIFE